MFPTRQQTAPRPARLDAQDGERVAAALIDAKPCLLQMAERLCGNAADAHDLLQSLFERVWRIGMPPEIANTRAWLTTSLHNLFIDHCRRLARQPAHLAIEPEHEQVADAALDVAAEPAWTQITLADIRAAAGELASPFREIYLAHTFDQQTYQQIAEALDIRQVTVGTRLNRARKKLRAVLAKRFGLERTP